MKTKLYATYVVFVGSLMISALSNAMDHIREIQSNVWLNILHANGVPSPKAEQCAQLIPHFLSKHPQSAAELSILRTKPLPMQNSAFNEFCDKMLAAAKDEL